MPDIYDDLQALSGSMKIATGCIDALLKHQDKGLMPLDLDHLDRDMGEVKDNLARVYKHIINMQVSHEHSGN